MCEQPPVCVYSCCDFTCSIPTSTCTNFWVNDKLLEIIHIKQQMNLKLPITVVLSSLCTWFQWEILLGTKYLYLPQNLYAEIPNPFSVRVWGGGGTLRRSWGQTLWERDWCPHKTDFRPDRWLSLQRPQVLFLEPTLGEPRLCITPVPGRSETSDLHVSPGARTYPRHLHTYKQF